MAPDTVGPQADLLSLLVAHPEPVRGADGWWTCREASARIIDGALELGRHEPSSVEDRVDVARAACAAAWAAADDGVEIDATTVPELATA